MLVKINNKYYRLVKAKNVKLSRCYELRKNDILCEVYSTNVCRCYKVLTGVHKGILVYSLLRSYPYIEYKTEPVELTEEILNKLNKCVHIIRLYDFTIFLLRAIYLIIALISLAVLIYSSSISNLNIILVFLTCMVTTACTIVSTYMHIQVSDLYDKTLTINL